MISRNGTVVAKTETIIKEKSVEVELEPEWVALGRRDNHADLPRHITLKGPDADALNLGDRIKLTIEKIA